MRPGQKNRMRGGRGNNGGRRGPNPLTRSYESNGPDVKVRGTPQHIAEKYVQLARDAHSSGDTVMAESYLQHAEHYYRIIAAAQNAQQVAYNQANGIPNTGIEEPEDEDEFEVAGADRFTFRTPQSFQQPNQGNFNAGGFNAPQGFQPGQQPPYGDVPGIGDQPPMGADGQPVETGQQGFQPRPPRQDRPFDNRRPFEDRGDRAMGDRVGGDRGGRDRQGRRFGRDRNFGDRNFGDRPYGDRMNGETRPPENRPPEERQAEASQPMPDEQPGLPSFITGPSRAGGEESETMAFAGGEPQGEGRFRNRRRRRPRGEGGAPEAGGGEDQG